VLEAHFVGQLQRGGKGGVREAEDLFELRLGQADAVFEDLTAGGFKDFRACFVDGWNGCLNRH
jgi:hypothetical protein